MRDYTLRPVGRNCGQRTLDGSPKRHFSERYPLLDGCPAGQRFLGVRKALTA